MMFSGPTHIGFTGTRRGMTSEQEAQLRTIFHEVAGVDTVLHHGDCIGADYQAHKLAWYMGWRIEVHPCDIDNLRADSHIAYPSPTTIVHPAYLPLTRDRHIVKASSKLIATPHGYREIKRGSGTWYTIRRGLDARIPVFIIFPDGSLLVPTHKEELP